MVIHFLRDLVFKVLGKSVKPVPVMLLGVLVARKRYPLAKYFYVLLIVLGKSWKLLSKYWN
jgi:hypothetical protein